MLISSRLPGIFYRKPNPESPPYVEIGQRVTDSTVIGLVEVMKSFYEVKCDVAGVLEKFLVEDGVIVDIGQPLAEISAEHR